MEMTIDEAHEILSNGLVNAPSEHEWCVAFQLAIDTLEKYQKIERLLNVVSKIDGKDYYAYDYEARIKDIRKVIEDGNVD